MPAPSWLCTHPAAVPKRWGAVYTWSPGDAAGQHSALLPPATLPPAQPCPHHDHCSSLATPLTPYLAISSTRTTIAEKGPFQPLPLPLPPWEWSLVPCIAFGDQSDMALPNLKAASTGPMHQPTCLPLQHAVRHSPSSSRLLLGLSFPPSPPARARCSRLPFSLGSLLCPLFQPQTPYGAYPSMGHCTGTSPSPDFAPGLRENLSS